MRRKANIKKLLNLNVLDQTNVTIKLGNMDMPYITCTNVPDIDYLATYSRPSEYFHTENTCVSFFEFDIRFDGIFGLWNAIYYGDKKLQERYLTRFRGVKYFISPDYSKCGDAPEIENQYRNFRARIVSIWLTMSLNAIVIPLVSCANDIGMKYMLDGMEDCEVVAFNACGQTQDPKQRKIFQNAIKYTVDRLEKLKTIVVYSTSTDKTKILKLFQYAIKHEIKVIIPDNHHQIRHRIMGGDYYGSC